MSTCQSRPSKDGRAVSLPLLFPPPASPTNLSLFSPHSLKIPPITRALVGLVLIISVGPILHLANPYTFLLWWPAVLKKQQVWRLVTCFFLAGGGNMQIIFDVFMLG